MKPLGVLAFGFASGLMLIGHGVGSAYAQLTPPSNADGYYVDPELPSSFASRPPHFAPRVASREATMSSPQAVVVPDPVANTAVPQPLANAGAASTIEIGGLVGLGTAVQQVEQPTSSTQWTVEQAAAWAYAKAPTAQLLEMERRAVARGLDCDDEKQRARVGLIQAVSAELATHYRNESAADAMMAYYGLVAAREQLKLLKRSIGPLEDLEAMAGEAEALELVDGDRDELADRRLQLEDQWFEIEYGVRRIQSRLGDLIGRTDLARGEVELVSPLATDLGVPLDAEALTTAALVNRRDLIAIETLCRCMNEDSLPAARELLGAFVPGLGSDAGLASRAKGLLCLQLADKGDDEAAELATRRAQCRDLANARRDQIRRQVNDAVLQMEGAMRRVDVAQRRVQAKQDVVARTRRAEQLEQLPPGSWEKAQLELLQIRSVYLQRQLDLAEAVVKVKRMTGRVD